MGSTPILRANKGISITNASRLKRLLQTGREFQIGYKAYGYQRSFLIIDMLLSKSVEVASHVSSERLLTNKQGAHSNYKDNLYVIGSTPILQARKFCSQLNRQSERIFGALIHTEVTQLAECGNCADGSTPSWPGGYVGSSPTFCVYFSFPF